MVTTYHLGTGSGAADAAGSGEPLDVELLTRLLRPEEVASRLGVSRAQVYLLIAPGGPLPSVTIGRSRRITMRDLADYIATLRAASDLDRHGQRHDRFPY